MPSFPIFLTNPAKTPDEIAKGFSWGNYTAMILDQNRNQAYKKAIQRLVKDQRLLEIGPGPKLFLTKLCIQHGASHVSACEKNLTSAIKAENFSRNSGLSDKIKIILGDAINFEDLEEIDIVIQEVFGSIGSAEGIVPVVKRLKERSPKSLIFIPEKFTTYIVPVAFAPVSSMSLGLTKILSSNSKPKETKIFKGYSGGIPRRALVPQIFEHFDFNDDLDLVQRRELRWSLKNDFVFSGFQFFLELDFGEGVKFSSWGGFSNWSNPYIELFPKKLRCFAGGEISLRTEVDLSRDVPNYSIEGHALPRPELTKEAFYFSWSGI